MEDFDNLFSFYRDPEVVKYTHRLERLTTKVK